jgi:SpoVK/Ycf46/Vps4 family AAA+-type ATPase
MELLVNQTLQAQGHGQIKCSQADDSVYNPAYINADFDPTGLVEGIRRANAARLCLYGPPGTGKTAFATWLAVQLGRKILVKRASDLLSRYLGEAEKNIAGAFREAAESEAVLVIDEVDSFLQERAKAQRSFEVTQVNEFLTQMEQFDGIFIASTNLVEGLDAASLRRFDLKAKFDYLRPAQANALLMAHLGAASVSPAGRDEQSRIEALANLTPGDFAAVARQHRFRPLASAAAWVSALDAECSRKPAYQRKITGFSNLTNAR